MVCSVALFAACSGGEGVEPATVPEEGQTAISFIGGQQEEQAVTRAATGLETLLNEKTFKVWGYKNDAYDAGTGSYTSYQTVMPNYVVSWTANTAYTTTTNTNDWEYVGLGTGSDQEIKYWDFGANAYRFFGYAKGNATAAEHANPADPSSAIVTPATPQVAVTENGLAADAISFTAEVDASTDAAFHAAPYFTRLWFSDGNPTNYPDRQFGRPVQLQFLKPFARVRFMFTFVEGVAKRKDLKNITFHPTDLEAHITTSGTVTVSYPLKGTATTESWTFTPGTNYLNAFLLSDCLIEFLDCSINSIAVMLGFILFGNTGADKNCLCIWYTPFYIRTMRLHRRKHIRKTGQQLGTILLYKQIYRVTAR